MMKGTITIEINNVDQGKLPDETCDDISIAINAADLDASGAITITKALMDSLGFTGELSMMFAMMLIGKIPWPFEIEDHQRTPLNYTEGDCCDEG